MRLRGGGGDTGKNKRFVGYVGLFTLVPMLLCVVTELMSPAPKELCQLSPMITGEKVIPVTMEPPLPTQLQPGHLVTLRLSRGYMFPNYAIACPNGEDNYVDRGTAHRDTLAWSEYTRTTHITLSGSDDQCAIELIVTPEKPHYAVTCGDGEVVGHIAQTKLPQDVYSRTVSVHLDPVGNVYLAEDSLTSTQCEKECSLEFEIPSNTLPGMHKLYILLKPHTGWYQFDIEVVEKGTPAP